MDLKDPKIQKLLLGGMVIFLVIYFWYARIYSKNARSIEEKQVQYENLLSDLKSVEMKVKSFESLKEEYENLFERYRKVERLLPEEKQIPQFLIQMHFAGRANEAGIMQILPQAPVPVSFYNTSSFEVDVTGSYHRLGNFLGSIANFPFLANVSDVTITAVGEKENSIAASLKLTTYYVKEEEKLQKIEF